MEEINSVEDIAVEFDYVVEEVLEKIDYRENVLGYPVMEGITLNVVFKSIDIPGVSKPEVFDRIVERYERFKFHKLQKGVDYEVAKSIRYTAKNGMTVGSGKKIALVVYNYRMKL